MKRQLFSGIFGFFFVWLFVFYLGGTAAAEQLVAREHQTTTTPTYDSQPVVDADSRGPVIIYTSRALGPMGYGPGVVFYQRLTNDGELVGNPVRVSTGGTNDQGDDISGKYVVYTAYDSILALSGRTIIYNIESGSAAVLAAASALRETRIQGDYVVWLQGAPSTSSLMLFDLKDFGTGIYARPIAGPTPTVADPAIGSRFIVWDELTDGQLDVYAYDLVTKVKYVVANDPAVDESFPATDGPWVVYEEKKPGLIDTRIVAKNLDTGELRVIVDNGAPSHAPSISGNLITYDTRSTGNFDVFVHRIRENDTFLVTTNTLDQRSNSLFGDLAAYVDGRTGTLDVFVSKLQFVADDQPPIANAGADQTVEATSPAGALVTLNGNASSDPGGSQLSFLWSGPFGTLTGNPASVTLPIGSHTITLAVTNADGKTATDSVLVTVRDTQKPVTGYSLSGTIGSNGWYVSNVYAVLSALDAGSGIKEIRYQVDNDIEHVIFGTTAAMNLVTDGTHTVAYHAEDNAGNTEDPAGFLVRIDQTPPEVGMLVSPEGNAFGWNNTDVTISYMCADTTSGVDVCPQDQLVTTEDVGPLVVGTTTDRAGLSSFAMTYIYLDKTAPDVNSVVNGVKNDQGEYVSTASLALKAEDSLSGLSRTYYTVFDGTGTALFSNPEPIILRENGAYVVRYGAEDWAGNRTSLASEVTVSKTPVSFLSAWGGRMQFSNPNGVAIDKEGNVYTADTGNHRVLVFDSAGTFVLSWGSRGSDRGQFISPRGIAIDGSGNIYVADSGNNRVQVFDARGNLIDVWDAIMKSKTREFSQPEGIATDGKLIYVADSGNNRILLFDPRGDLLYEFGYYGPKGGQFSNPTSLAVSGMNVFVADTGNDRIQSFTNDGSGHFRFLNEWGRTGTGAGEFKSPRGIALIAGGQAVLVSDSGNNRIQMFDPKGRYLREFGGQGQAFGLFLNPAGMAVDAKGNITVADAGNNRIQVLAEKGYFLTSWGNFGKESGAFAFPRDAAVDGNGNIFVADTLNHRIQAFDSAGIFLREWGVYGINKGEFDSPAGIAVDEKGLVFVSDTLNNRIQAFTGDGKFVTVWGSLGTGKGQFSEPRGIATDSRGAVYVADALNHRIQVLDRQGAFVNFLGHKGSGDGELIYPSDVTVDETGNVYVADSGNNRVQVFDAKGNYISQWGKPGPAGNQFDNPTGIALDGNGRLVYVTDANNHRVQVFDKAGQFVTDWGSPGTGSGQFAFPAGVAVSACNTVYVADSANGRIEAFEGLGTKGEIVANAGPDQTIEQASVNGALVTLDGSASTESCGSSLTYEWSWAGGSASGPAPAVYLPAGRTTITLTARNGILFATDTVDVTIADTQKPSSAAAVSGTAGTNGWYSSGVKVALSATDAGSGMKEIRYHVNGGAETIVPGNAALIDLVSDGAYTVAYYSVDNADNREDPREIFVKIDAIAPVITSVVAPAPNAAGWNKEDVVVSFLCSDARSGVANCSAPVTIGSEVKDQVIAGSASDNAGNSASTSVTVNVDKTAPAIIVSGIQNGATYEFGLVPAAGYTVSDAYSGVATSSGTLGGGDGMGLGAFTYSVTASDNAGNSATVTTAYTVIATPTGTIAVVDQLVDTGAVTGAEAAILTDMLTAALAAPNTQSQANKLNAMINHINAKTGKDITADAAAILINAANHIIKH